MKNFIIPICLLLCFNQSFAEDGYLLWLRYDKVSNQTLLAKYRKLITSISINESSPTLLAAKNEIEKGLYGLLNKKIQIVSIVSDYSVIIGTKQNPLISNLINDEDLKQSGNEGFIIRSLLTKNKHLILITANKEIGVLYGVFHFLRLIQTEQSLENISIISTPKIQLRVLDHWDNLNRTVERGYAGISIWNWQTLPLYLDQRYTDYARANASIGINGSVLNNVNANALILTKDYLVKAAALANIFRPYGIKVYLSARFSAPIEIGGLKTADPLDKDVQKWWKEKADEIYQYIPDFGGFLVKANSEGQPGPQTYGRTHADGANMLADALISHNGIVIWRAFVYSNNSEDRFKQAYDEFKPLDGKFRSNVLLQVKNGPIDFQPREPFHPLFGAMPQTPLMIEFQLTQEYLGFATHLVYEPTLFKECLDADTYSKGKGSTVAKVIAGTVDGHSLSGIAGVSNIGNERNWTGHPFGQANWYAFGRLAWNPDLSSSGIAEEWIRQTFSNNPVFVREVKQIMLASREILVDYMTPLGLHHIMGYSHHYGPAPWYHTAPRADWNPVYFHRADSFGIGFDRTVNGSNALSEYAPEVQHQFENLNTCPEPYLLWFHHVSWNYKMKDGNTLWQELCLKYYTGVDSVRWMKKVWSGLKGYIDDDRFQQVQMLLNVQEKEAVWWRNACLLYFQRISHLRIPKEWEQPDHTLEYYQSLRFPFAPGIG